MRINDGVILLSANELLTPTQIEWFGHRMNESHTGRVLVPSHCYVKFRKIADNEFLSNLIIKTWLIDNIYNR